MSADLAAYVQATAGLPWAWGKQDCTIWVADWCVLRWGIDPAARLRGKYDSETGALALTSCGLVVAVAPEIVLPRKVIPSEGDIGVIEFRGRQVSAIWSGSHWLFRTPRGVGMTRCAALSIWGD
ncbi:DUF6950 family protein [Paracoccus laeviglucosivorans]|uniref:DUF6950 domain-containing protein n=1 Tax=Paracoccus laeviglucosivorans TaxID=1197861 RepID=A0A521E480_9RHOB|nr:hypothetical protein [Paracoccus laeviglucosivorans]SMO78665.1 hypothetical protein SAMN06265221_11144 [Paracoccus laeviglucosivorans]